ncbi:MAG: hypothetical protein KAH38_13305, partial [Candidatus Hydrogenedentes bacterium]|nr:hypothetical protein [Candidatus Hydrogenedentota bacterium]
RSLLASQFPNVVKMLEDNAEKEKKSLARAALQEHGRADGAPLGIPITGVGDEEAALLALIGIELNSGDGIVSINETPVDSVDGLLNVSHEIQKKLDEGTLDEITVVIQRSWEKRVELHIELL